MADVADYTIGYADWLAIATTAQAPVRAPGRKAPDSTDHAARSADGGPRAAAHLDPRAARRSGSTGRETGHHAVGHVFAAASGLAVPVA